MEGLLQRNLRFTGGLKHCLTVYLKVSFWTRNKIRLNRFKIWIGLDRLMELLGSINLCTRWQGYLILIPIWKNVKGILLFKKNGGTMFRTYRLRFFLLLLFVLIILGFMDLEEWQWMCLYNQEQFKEFSDLIQTCYHKIAWLLPKKPTNWNGTIYK